jgi:hypothetical protein
MNQVDFKAYIKANDNADICRNYLFSSDFWLLKEKGFQNPNATYDEIKLFFADRFSLSNNNIGVVGSAKTGFSLNPDKNFRAFDKEESDIDVVLVSDKHFSLLWQELLNLYYSPGSYVSSSEQTAVFRRFIWLKRDNSYPSALMRDWNQKMDALKSDFFTKFQIANKLTYRIYQTWEAVEQYHVAGIAKLRKNLDGGDNAKTE